jgi:hypothetical protein
MTPQSQSRSRRLAASAHSFAILRANYDPKPWIERGAGFRSGGRLCGIAGLDERLRVAGNGFEVGAGGLIGGDAALFPTAQGAEEDLIAAREFFLGEAKRAAEGFRAGDWRRRARDSTVRG